MRWAEDEGARDESPRHFGLCGTFVVLHSIFGDSARQSAVSSNCWEKQYAAAWGVDARSFTPRAFSRGGVGLVQMCKGSVIESLWVDCWENAGSAAGWRICHVIKDKLRD